MSETLSNLCETDPMIRYHSYCWTGILGRWEEFAEIACELLSKMSRSRKTEFFDEYRFSKFEYWDLWV